MLSQQTLKDKANEIKGVEFQIEDVDYVPDINTSKLTFGCTGLRFWATVLYIDMRHSTDVLNAHYKQNVAKIHMIYYYTIVNIAKETGGSIRSFNGDSLLVFYRGTSKEITNNAVQAAMQMRYALTSVVNTAIGYYGEEIDFGIGIDYGDILATKVGLGRDSNTKDLIWIGNAVNRSTKISDECKNPNYIGISETVYNRLNRLHQFGKTKNYWGQEIEQNMWTSAYMDYAGNNLETYYRTTWWWRI